MDIGRLKDKLNRYINIGVSIFRIHMGGVWEILPDGNTARRGRVGGKRLAYYSINEVFLWIEIKKLII